MNKQLNFLDIPSQSENRLNELFPKEVQDYARNKGYKVKVYEDWIYCCEIHLSNGFVMILEKYFRKDDKYLVYLHDHNGDEIPFDYGYGGDKLNDEEALKFLKILETKSLFEKPLFIMRGKP